MGTPTAHVFDLIIQKSDDDCAIACLAMYLGLPYITIREQARRLKSGLTTRQVLNLSKRLGHPLKLQPTYSTEDVGMLDIEREHDGHLVLYVQGVVYTPASGQLWAEAETFIQTGGWTVNGLIVHRNSRQRESAWE